MEFCRLLERPRFVTVLPLKVADVLFALPESSHIADRSTSPSQKPDIMYARYSSAFAKVAESTFDQHFQSSSGVGAARRTLGEAFTVSDRLQEAEGCPVTRDQYISLPSSPSCSHCYSEMCRDQVACVNDYKVPTNSYKQPSVARL